MSYDIYNYNNIFKASPAHSTHITSTHITSSPHMYMYMYHLHTHHILTPHIHVSPPHTSHPHPTCTCTCITSTHITSSLHTHHLHTHHILHPSSIAADIKSVVYSVGVAYGSDVEWDFVWQRYLSSTDPYEKGLFLRALAESQTPWLLSRYVKLYMYMYVHVHVCTSSLQL